MKDFLVLVLISALCWTVACEPEDPPEPAYQSMGRIPASGDTTLHAVMGVMEGFYAVSVADSIVRIVEATVEDEGALLFSTRQRGNIDVSRIGDLRVFVIQVPVEFAGQTIVIQTSNTSPCASDGPWTSEGQVVPDDGIVYVDVNHERVPFMDFYVIGFIPPVHGQYWRLSRTF